jgi:hypothetical protein
LPDIVGRESSPDYKQLNQIFKRSLTNDQQSIEIEDDMARMQNLSLINANARFELLNANQQLLDFQMTRLIKYENHRKKSKQKTNHNNSDLQVSMNKGTRDKYSDSVLMPSDIINFTSNGKVAKELGNITIQNNKLSQLGPLRPEMDTEFSIDEIGGSNNKHYWTETNGTGQSVKVSVRESKARGKDLIDKPHNKGKPSMDNRMHLNIKPMYDIL